MLKVTDQAVDAAVAGWKYFTDKYGLAYPKSALRTALNEALPHLRRTDRDVRRETADEIASVLETRSEAVMARSKDLRGEEFWTHVGLARGLNLAAEIAAKTGRQEPP